MKKIIIFILTMVLLLIGQNTLAFQSNAIVNFEAPYATFYKGTFDNLVMDFSLVVTNSDTINALSLKNLGNASYLRNIKNMVLWTDAGSLAFRA